MTEHTRRPKRVPIGQRDVLTVKGRDPKFEYRWVNDANGRVDMFEEAGYTAVRDPTEVGDPKAGDASQLGSTVRKPVGGGISAVLMKIPKNFYREDQAAKETRIAEKEQSLLNEATGDGYYGKGVKITRPKTVIE